MDERLRKLARAARMGDQDSLLRLLHLIKKQYTVPQYHILNTNLFHNSLRGRKVFLPQVCLVPVFSYSYQVLLSPRTPFSYVDVPFQVESEFRGLSIDGNRHDGMLNYWTPASLRLGSGGAWLRPHVYDDSDFQFELVDYLNDGLQPHLLAFFGTKTLSCNERAATMLLNINRVISPHSSDRDRNEALLGIFEATGL